MRVIPKLFHPAPWRRASGAAATFASVVTLILLLPSPADASLGGDAQSVVTDGSALSAQARSPQAHPLYTMTELQSDSVTVREYADLSGQIFAVAWTGLTQPDLSKLLGPMYEEYRQQSEVQGRIAGRRAVRGISSPHMIVQTSGHMRRQTGRAYLRARIPSGVSLDEIR